MDRTIQSVFNLPDVSFIENDTIEDMMQRMVSNFESKHEEITGKPITLGRGDERRLILYTAAMELFHIEQHVDRAGKQDLLKYSYGEFLDNLAGNRGVVRQPASPAKTTLRFTLSQALGFVVVIPEGTRATNGEGLTFETTEYAEVPVGETYVDVPSQCTETGIEGNDFLPGQIDDLVDTIGYVESVANITTTAGGAAVESDKSLAERTFLAPASYSVAGPESAYIFWVRTFNAAIGSVKVVSPSACAVDVYILMQDGTIPGSDIISGLEQLLEDSGIRPLTDQVTVKTPTTASFSVNLTYYIAALIQRIKKPEETQNDRLSKVEEELKRHQDFLASDKKRLDAIEEGNRMSMRAQLALLSHSLDGNDVEALKDSKKELQECQRTY